MAKWTFSLKLTYWSFLVLICSEKSNSQNNRYCSRPTPCQVGVVQPDPEDCRKYYECNRGGQWKNPSCSKRLSFDSVSLECLDENDAVCADDCKTVPVERNPCLEPPLPCTTGSVEPNFKDCGFFYICDGGSWHDTPCRNSTLFDPDSKRCVPASQSDCEERCTRIDDPIELPTQIPTIIPTQQQPITSKEPVTSINKTIFSLACDVNAHCPLLTQLPDPNDCTRFYFCDQNGIRRVQQCLFQARFDAVSLQCKPSDQATCMPQCQSVTTTKFGSSDPSTGTTVAEQIQTIDPSSIIDVILDKVCNLPLVCVILDVVPVPGNCSVYRYCTSGGAYQIGVCPQGQRFDILQRKCVQANALCMPDIPCSPVNPTLPNMPTAPTNAHESTLPPNLVTIPTLPTTPVPLPTLPPIPVTVPASTRPPTPPATQGPGTTSTVVYSKQTSTVNLPNRASTTTVSYGTNATSNTSSLANQSTSPSLITSSTKSFDNATVDYLSTTIATRIPNINNSTSLNYNRTDTMSSSVSIPISTEVTNEYTTSDMDILASGSVTQSTTRTVGITETLENVTTETLVITQDATTNEYALTTEMKHPATSDLTSQLFDVTTYQDVSTDSGPITEEVQSTWRLSDGGVTHEVSTSYFPEPDSQTDAVKEILTTGESLVQELSTAIEVTSEEYKPTERTLTSTVTSTIDVEAPETTRTKELSTRAPEIMIACEENVDSNGLTWASVLIGRVSTLPCPSSLKGSIVRQCKSGKNGSPVWQAPVNFCVDPPYADILQQTGAILMNDQASMQKARYLSRKLRTVILDDLSSKKELTPGNVNASLQAALELSQIVVFGARQDPDIAKATTISIGENVNEILNQNSTFDQLGEQNKDIGGKIMNTTENLGQAYSRTLQPGTSENITFETFSILTVSLPQNQTDSLTFNVNVSDGAPLLRLNYSTTESNDTLDSIEVKPATLLAMAQNAGTENLVLWTTYHYRLGMLMPATKNMIINSRILALTVEDLQAGFTFHPPITLRFSPINKTLLINKTFCSYWQYTSMTSGYWSQDGCFLKSNDTNQTTCECNHLTSFAVLVSPYLADGKHAKILSLISLIGCLLSILGCFATIVFYILAWKEVKSQHAIVLLNLCAVLIIANVIFLVGIDKVQFETVCTVVAALLHFFWLVAFMVMLADGVMFILYVVYVFHVKRKRETVLLLATAWFVPAIIVGVTLGVTRTKGYGTKEYCWLERTSGLIAAFIAPVCVIVFANFVVLIKVLHTAATSKSNEHKNRNRIVAVIWNIMVILPLLGIAWIFGLLSVNEQTIAFQYIFAIANSLQGFFIFLFHCACNKKLRNGVSSRFSIRGSNTSSLKSNKLNNAAHLRNTNNKNNNLLNKKSQEEKAKKSIQRAQLKECPPPTSNPWLPRLSFSKVKDQGQQGQSNTNDDPSLQGQDNECFQEDKSIRRKIEPFQLGERAADSIIIAPEFIDVCEETPMFTENDPVYMEIHRNDSNAEPAQTVMNL